MNKLTIKMLARELGLSVSTVSKAISDSYEISDTTKQRVNDLAKKLNYVPNHHASSLGSRKSKTIGVVIPEVVDSFFAKAINGIESIAQEKGYHVLIYLTHELVERERKILKEFESGRVDGVLLSISRETNQYSHIDALMNKAVPLVFFDRVVDEVETTKIVTNDYEMAYRATEHLIHAGCRQILFLSFLNALSISNRRFRGYKEALLDNGQKFNNGNVLAFQNDSKKDYLQLKRKLSSAKRADGIIASVEKLSLPVYQVCEELKLKIPGDIQLIGFSNQDAASFLNPPLTTITQPAFEMGKTAAALLVKALEQKHIEVPTEEIIIPSLLMLRKSTKNSKQKLRSDIIR
jgi:LacI family transcriptional regulator